MPTICFRPCMVLDAICYFQQSSLNERKWMFDDEIKLIEMINRELSNKIDGNCLGMSTLSLIISTYTNNENLENYTLDDLISVFRNFEDVDFVVRKRITNEFTASYLFPMLGWLKNGWSEKYIAKLNALKTIGFENIWKSEMYPRITEYINKKQKSIKDIDTSALFKNIAIMKNVEVIPDVKIFVSFLSYPTAFTLYNGCFLDTFGANIDMLFTVAHELMHGFASDELISNYLNYINNNEYLKLCHQILIDKMYSGNEEEFVTAAEYYLGYLAGILQKDKILEFGRKRYNGCMPLSVIIFDLLTKEERVPNNYNRWIIDKFIKNVFPVNNVKEYIALL